MPLLYYVRLIKPRSLRPKITLSVSALLLHPPWYDVIRETGCPELAEKLPIIRGYLCGIRLCSAALFRVHLQLEENNHQNASRVQVIVIILQRRCFSRPTGN